MARQDLALATNIAGDFFVDETCIDCDACRQIAPAVFRQAGDQSAVYAQPGAPEERLAAEKALIACPTASIGTRERHDLKDAVRSFPDRIAENVYFCGYTSESSFGAWSYLIQRERGNVMIDSPRFASLLIRNIEAMGGVETMLLTHRDDVADHEKFHHKLGTRRVLHRDDVSSSTLGVEMQPSGFDPVAIDDEIVMIPVPGHTKGHAVFLYRNRFLFSGDHLAWSESRGHLYAFRSACWYSWSEQIRSMERLLDFSFEWVLPGHGRAVHLPAAAMRASLVTCIDWMKRQ